MKKSDDESVIEFEQRFTTLSYHVPYLIPNEKTMIEMFIGALSGVYAGRMTGVVYPTFLDAVGATMAIETKRAYSARPRDFNGPSQGPSKKAASSSISRSSASSGHSSGSSSGARNRAKRRFKMSSRSQLGKQQTRQFGLGGSFQGGTSGGQAFSFGQQQSAGCFECDGSKTGQGRRGYLQEGAWDAIHVIEVGPEEEGTTNYRLTSTVMLSLTTDNEPSGTFSLSGSLRRQMNMRLSVEEGHLCNMGRMIEEMEGKLRNSLEQVYFGKTKEMVCTLRPPAEVVMRLPSS
ncbi:PREDICTED: probable F-actin-capping protein subunit beta [Fragaria vesca subsp. vesca]|uniref:probable F-actin-capping protein subunit beta n=1 Tax=Fragaria vesca subsp. vesca TaxID=101020 RepID=UPI0002C2F0EF|nr:PREDICTED: probable F-actin-capping protein subunit beta [Fragaria vesca subsp. vesca]